MNGMKDITTVTMDTPEKRLYFFGDVSTPTPHKLLHEHISFYKSKMSHNT